MHSLKNLKLADSWLTMEMQRLVQTTASMISNATTTGYRDAQIHLSLCDVDIGSNRVLLSQVYRTDTKEAGVGAGIFSGVDHLLSSRSRQ